MERNWAPGSSAVELLRTPLAADTDSSSATDLTRDEESSVLLFGAATRQTKTSLTLPPRQYCVQFRMFFRARYDCDDSHSDEPHIPVSSAYLHQPKSLEQLCVPIRQHLSMVSIDDLIRDFTRRAARRFPVLMSHLQVKALLVRRPGAETAVLDLPSLEEAVTQYQAEVCAKSAFPSPSLKEKARLEAKAREPQDAAQFTHVDACMNAEDTLDNFFAVPYSAQDVCDYDVVVQWEQNADNTTDTCDRNVCSDDDVVAAKGGDHYHSLPVNATWPRQRQLSNSASMGLNNTNNKVVRPVVDVTPVFPTAPRSTYMDLLLRKQKVGAKQVTPMWELDNKKDDMSDSSFGSMDDVLVASHKQKQNEERRALGLEELKCRADVIFTQDSERGLLVDLEDDALRHILTLEALQGDFTQNGQLAALLRKRRCYPFDTLPLANEPDDEYREQLGMGGNYTAAMSFKYASDDWVLAAKARIKMQEDAALLEIPVEEMEAFAAARLSGGSGDDKAFSRNIHERVEKRHELMEKEEFEKNRVAYYTSIGEEAPPRTPTPPPPPRTPRIEDLPEDVFEGALSSYTDGRRDIVTMERMAFRSMTRLMEEVLHKQRGLDAKAVREAYREELRATGDVFDMGAYVPYNQKALLTSSCEKPLYATGISSLLAAVGIADAADNTSNNNNNNNTRSSGSSDSGASSLSIPDNAIAAEVQERLKVIMQNVSLPLADRMSRQCHVKEERHAREAILGDEKFEWSSLHARIQSAVATNGRTESERAAVALLTEPLGRSEASERVITLDEERSAFSLMALLAPPKPLSSA